MPSNDMLKANRSAQKNNTEDVFNRDKPKDGPRHTAKGEEGFERFGGPQASWPSSIAE